MKTPDLKTLPSEYHCNSCGLTKPTELMNLKYLKGEQVYYLRPRCKDCMNSFERGHRREWKRDYLRKWRRKNAALDRSYWNNSTVREYNRQKNARRNVEKHDALAIQRRLRHRGITVSITEAEEMLDKYGRCYPTRHGLSKEGLREQERIRSAMRRQGRKMTNFEIRLMIYEDGIETPSLLIKPERQPTPYKANARIMKERQAAKKRGNNEI